MAFSSLYCETSPKSAVGLLVVGGLAAAAVVAAVVVAGVLACELLLVLAATLTPCFFMSKTGVPPLYHYPQVIRLSPQYTACRFSKNYRVFFTYIFWSFWLGLFVLYDCGTECPVWGICLCSGAHPATEQFFGRISGGGGGGGGVR